MQDKSDLFEKDFPAENFDARLVARLAKYLRPFIKGLSVSVVLVLVITAVELILPYLTKVVLIIIS
jgi:hypothetical protein